MADTRTLLQYLQGNQYLPNQAELARQARIKQLLGANTPAPLLTEKVPFNLADDLRKKQYAEYLNNKALTLSGWGQPTAPPVSPFTGFPNPGGEAGMEEARLPLASRTGPYAPGIPNPFASFPSDMQAMGRDLNNVGLSIDRGLRPLVTPAPRVEGPPYVGTGVEGEAGMEDARLALALRALGLPTSDTGPQPIASPAARAEDSRVDRRDQAIAAGGQQIGPAPNPFDLTSQLAARQAAADEIRALAGTPASAQTAPPPLVQGLGARTQPTTLPQAQGYAELKQKASNVLNRNDVMPDRFRGFPDVEGEAGMEDARLALSLRKKDRTGEDTGYLPPDAFPDEYGQDFFGLVPDAGRIYAKGEKAVPAGTTPPAEEVPLPPSQIDEMFKLHELSPELGAVVAKNPEVIGDIMAKRGIAPPSGKSPISSALSAVKAPAKPQLQRISSPSAPRPQAISQGTSLSQLFSQLAGNPNALNQLRLQQAVGRRYNG